jgi:hypothetical protein
MNVCEPTEQLNALACLDFSITLNHLYINESR